MLVNNLKWMFCHFVLPATQKNIKNYLNKYSLRAQKLHPVQSPATQRECITFLKVDGRHIFHQVATLWRRMIEVCVFLFPSASYFNSQDQLNSAKVTATLQKPHGQLWLYGFDGKSVHIGDAAVASQSRHSSPKPAPSVTARLLASTTTGVNKVWVFFFFPGKYNWK